MTPIEALSHSIDGLKDVLDAATKAVTTSQHDALLTGIVVLVATASLVSASVSRQENLSSRTRSLACEFRAIASKVEPWSMIETNRLGHLLIEIELFRGRLRNCVRAHIALYWAFAIEMVGFGGMLITDSAKGKSWYSLEMLWTFVAVVAFVLVVYGLWLHIKEYMSSDETIDLELEDLDEYRRAYVKVTASNGQTLDVRAFRTAIARTRLV